LKRESREQGTSLGSSRASRSGHQTRSEKFLASTRLFGRTAETDIESFHVPFEMD
jgi:hypothetical protein